MGFLLGDALAFPNLDHRRPEGPLTSTPDMWRSLMGAFVPIGWDDLADLRERWPGKIILKGCVNADDVVRAADMGLDAAQISNHGGRQLDHMASPLDVLPEIVDRVQGRIEIYVDGGIRRGTDVLKAIALGADAVSIGRPYLYGLAAEGEHGVARVIDLFRQEIVRAMCLLGCDTTTKSGRARRIPTVSAAATCAAVSDPLNLSVAMSTRAMKDPISFGSGSTPSQDSSGRCSPRRCWRSSQVDRQ